MLTSDKIHQLRSRLGLLLGTSSKARVISVSALFLAICAFGAAAVAPLAPDVSDLPEALSAAEFSRRYGAVGAPAYQRLLADIEARLDRVPLLR